MENCIWILKELTETLVPGEFLTKGIRLHIKFCWPYDTAKEFEVLDIVPTTRNVPEGPIPKMGFDEWW